MHVVSFSGCGTKGRHRRKAALRGAARARRPADDPQGRERSWKQVNLVARRCRPTVTTRAEMLLELAKTQRRTHHTIENASKHPPALRNLGRRRALTDLPSAQVRGGSRVRLSCAARGVPRFSSNSQLRRVVESSAFGIEKDDRPLGVLKDTVGRFEEWILCTFGCPTVWNTFLRCRDASYTFGATSYLRTFHNPDEDGQVPLELLALGVEFGLLAGPVRVGPSEPLTAVATGGFCIERPAAQVRGLPTPP